MRYCQGQSAAILIGGRARRLQGRVKSALLVGNRPILARQLATLHATGIDDVVLVGHWHGDQPPPVPVVGDAIEQAGALGGLYTALLTAIGNPVLILAGDMPFVNESLIAHLCALPADSDGRVPRSEDGIHPLCACYRRRIAAHVKQSLDRGVLHVRAALGGLNLSEIGPEELRTIDPSGLVLTNVNTPDDYARACDLAIASGTPRA